MVAYSWPRPDLHLGAECYDASMKKKLEVDGSMVRKSSIRGDGKLGAFLERRGVALSDQGQSNVGPDGGHRYPQS